MDAVCVGLGVCLLLRGEQLPLAQRVHGGVGVLAELGEGGDVDEVDGDAAEVPRQHPARHAVQPPVRADVEGLRPVHDRLRLHGALDAAAVAPSPRRDVVGRHAHEEDSGSVGVDVAVHPFCPRLEHLPVRHRPVHQSVLAPPSCCSLVMIPQSTTSF